MTYPRLPYERPRNPFRLLRPSQAILARARAAGVDSSRGAEVKAWRDAGEPKQWP